MKRGSVARYLDLEAAVDDDDEEILDEADDEMGEIF
jgi:hypothetical protein